MTPPELSANLLDRAEALCSIGRYREALAAALQAVGAEPHNAQALATASRMHLCLGEAREGLRRAEESAAADPTWYYPHRLRCLVLVHLGRTIEAMAAAREAVRLAPDEPEALKALIECRLAANEAEEALPVAERILSLAPESAASYITLGRVALHLHQLDRASWAANRAIALDPECIDARLLLGERLQKAGLTDEAIGLYTVAGRIDPSDDKPRTAIGRAGGEFSCLLYTFYVLAPVFLWFPLYLHGSLSGAAALLLSIALPLTAGTLLQAKAPRALLQIQPRFGRLPAPARETIVLTFQRSWRFDLVAGAIVASLFATVTLFFLTAFYSAAIGTDRYLFDPPISSPEGRRLAAQRRQEAAREEREESQRTGRVHVEEYGGYEIRRIPPGGSAEGQK